MSIVQVPVKRITIPEQAACGDDRVRLLVVDCPFCGEEHRHGGDKLSEKVLYGLRGSHCGDGHKGGTYELVP